MGKSWKNPLKEEVAQKKGKLFSKLAKEITVSARIGGVNPQSNPRLKMAIAQAKAASCPKETIERSIKKALDQKTAHQENDIFELSYEAMGPYQSLFIIECQSENKNRTLSSLKTILKKHKSRMTEMGSVSWNFEKKSQVVASHKEIHLKDIEVEAIEVIANDVKQNPDKSCCFYGEEKDFESLQKALLERKWVIHEARVLYEPKNKILLNSDEKDVVFSLFQALKEDEDVSQVYVNTSLDI